MTRKDHLSAREAAADLGVSLATLYAYVSRGLIRSEADTAGSRTRRYRGEDVRALQEKREQRRDPTRVAEKALHLGTPVLDSELCLIAGGRLHYRGRDAVALAARHTVEEVAGLLWAGDLAAPFPDELPKIESRRWRSLERLTGDLAPFESFETFLAAASAFDPHAYDLDPERVRRTGARMLRLLAARAAGRPPSREPIARLLQRSWAPSSPDLVRLFDAVLVLCADHELNASTFTARCAAAAGANPYAVVMAGLAALRGFRHGGVTEQVEGLFQAVGRPQDARPALEAILRRGELIPGFGHLLYVERDPRAAFLLEQIFARVPQSKGAALPRALIEAAEDLTGLAPNVDFAMVTLCHSLGLPRWTPFRLFTVARTVGWVAHAIEQYRDGRLIRPRARYVGELPPAGER